MTKFELNEIESTRANNFIAWHKRCRPKINSDTLPQYAPFSYIFTPLGIGTSIKIKCPYCGKEKNITDISSW